MLIYTHNDCLLKFNGQGHPERKERLESIISSIKSSDVVVEFKDSPLVNLDIVSFVHPKKHIENIFNDIPENGIVGVEKEPYADTMLCPNSKSAILRSCGSGIAACDDLMIKNERVFCAVRPPGHHAETTRANGFCFINNVAVAARYLQKKYNIGKVAIIDFDVHHKMEPKRFSIKISLLLMDHLMNFHYFQGLELKMRRVQEIFLMLL